MLETTTRDRKALRYYKLRMRNNGIRYIRAIDRFKRSQDSREVGSINLVQSEIQIRWFITNSMYLFISGLDITFFPTMISSTWSGQRTSLLPGKTQRIDLEWSIVLKKKPKPGMLVESYYL